MPGVQSTINNKRAARGPALPNTTSTKQMQGKPTARYAPVEELVEWVFAIAPKMRRLLLLLLLLKVRGREGHV
jgi:hypothetical protein